MYIPILKNRANEMSFLRKLAYSPVASKLTPLIEVVKEKNRGKDYSVILGELSSLFTEILVDFPKIAPQKNTDPDIARFVMTYRKLSRTAVMYTQLANISNLVPVISFAESHKISTGEISQCNKIMSVYAKVCFRLRSDDSFASNLAMIKPLLRQDDLLLVNISGNSLKDDAIISCNAIVNTFRVATGIKVIIQSDPRPVSLTNSSMLNPSGDVLQQIDTSIIEAINKRTIAYDGFSDYAGLTGILPTSQKGAEFSPAAVFYSKDKNAFIGFAGIKNRKNGLKDMANNIINSTHWRTYSSIHQQECPGCMEISSIAINGGSTQGTWKGITAAHYIYTMLE